MCKLAFQYHITMLPHIHGRLLMYDRAASLRNMLEASHRYVTPCYILDRLITA